MSRANKKIEDGIRRAIEAETPDVLPRVLLRIKEEGENTMTQTATAAPGVLEYPAQRAKGKARWIKSAVSIAAMVLLVFSAYFGYGALAPQATISFDVNPSIQLTVNRSEKILTATPLNQDGKTVLADMNLKNVDLEVAVHALIGSMVKHGYISEIKNSILITVDSGDAQKGETLQKKLSQNVESILSGYSLEGAVLSQSVTQDDRINQLAAQYNITPGKARLVEQLTAQDDTLDFAGVAALPINDINLLIAGRNTQLEGVEAKGRASADGYIGRDRAKSAALAHAGVSEADIVKLEIDLDYDDGRMVYEVEFDTAAGEYEYDIDAYTGAVLKYDRDVKAVTAPSAPATQETARLTKDQAKAIALGHAGVVEADVRDLEIELDEDDGSWRYEIEFKTSAGKYEVDVDAYSGAVLKYETDLKTNAPVSGTAPAMLTRDQAMAAALRHAGVQAANVVKSEIELDEDDGRFLYEIEFRTATGEYEYDIDAYTGDVLKQEHKAGKTASGSAATGAAADAARAAALKDAGVSTNDVKMVKDVSYEKHGRQVYEFIFLSATTKYRYLVDGSSGEITGRYSYDLHDDDDWDDDDDDDDDWDDDWDDR